VKFDSRAMMFSARMLIYPKSTMHILRMLVKTYLSSGHVTLLWGEFQPLKLFHVRQTYGARQLHIDLCSIFLVISFFVLWVKKNFSTN